jgi:hypothetical protein
MQIHFSVDDLPIRILKSNLDYQSLPDTSAIFSPSGRIEKLSEKVSSNSVRTARDHCPELCQHSTGPHIFVYILANSQPNSKIFFSMNQGPRWDCLRKKKPEIENLVALSL